ncbi:MAG: N-6 DNA methylase [candidate division Zixibacteria bacterium]|nr:N-6 DNA methylase [Candidatus Tariuqbacter arcticus]
MANERITEDIVRKHFNSCADECTIEEQKSSIPKIDKLLKNASKKGSGKGYPEFIISSLKNPDFIIVVECKANIAKHQSSTLDKYDEYAVDGALLYASFLSKEYDVLAIGVSGQNLKELKVSHYLYLKGEKKHVPIDFGNKLLDIDSYINGYLKSDEKLYQDYDKLLVFSKTLNKQLHSHKIQGSRRSLLLSGILIALEDPAFKTAYTKHGEPEDLANNLVNSLSSVLSKEIKGNKLDNLKQQYIFFKTDTSLGIKHILRDLISDIDKHINPFIKTQKYHDVLGEFYIEFLRYAYSEKKLGIVLTPPHITELFTDLARVDKNSVVYDNCAGTGGFLISAMKKMIDDAKKDKDKIKEIQKEQLFGVEYQDDPFALACSNMYIHHDGKANIIKGNCFDNEVMEQVKKYRPTAGFLNPPYRGDKKTDPDELEFVLNNLEVLQTGGICIAIVPMQCALAQKGKIYELKKRLLQKHTLEAVLSMPNELFSNQANVVSCVMIFTAHKPHPTNKETYFGYYKDDGFVKRKNKGRIDAFDKWEKSIKAEWVASYINRKAKVGFSVNKIVTANDEWCAEAYMETDYKKFKKDDFIKSIHDFVSFQFNIGNIQEIKNEALINNEFSLFNKNWEYFRYEDLFSSISRGQRLIRSNRDEGDILYFSASEFNNGCTDKISNPLFVKKNAIIYTTFGDAYYVKGEFTASDEISIFQNERLNIFNGIFIATVISKNKYKYCFGRKAFKNKFINDFIALPVDSNNKPDWEFMENYIKSLPYSYNL